MLVDNVNNLFENFVNASVAAIEQRDPRPAVTPSASLT